MERLWAPWRHAYVTAEPSEGCLFCEAPKSEDEHHVITRHERCFVMLNAYPYNAGHLLVAPYEHVADLADCDERTCREMILVVRHACRLLRDVYKPQGLNVGMNIGAAAGAGIRSHIHMHIVPRWTGDTNFMHALSDTRVMSQSLEEAARLLREAARRLPFEGGR